MTMLSVTLLVLVSSVRGLQKFSSEPGDIVVKEGADVRLDCVVKDKEGTLQWTKDDFGLGETRELAGFSRYKMVGAEREGEWHLEIRNVSLEDDGRYQCQVGATHNAGPIRSRYAKLTVISTPQPPVITSGPYLVMSQGQETTVQCMSRGGKPAASLRWTVNGEVVKSGVQERVETISGSKRTMTVSFLTLTGVRNMSGSLLECSVESIKCSEMSLKSDVECRLRNIETEDMRVSTEIVIEHPPEVRLETDTDQITEADTVKIFCTALASPDLVEYQWHIGGQEVVEARGATELVLKADRQLNGQRVTCLARNKVGQSSSDMLLNIKYGPVFTAEPEPVVGNIGDRITVACNVDSNPPASYSWTRNGKIVGMGSSLSFHLSGQTSGAYVCTALAGDYAPVWRSVMVTMRGVPTLTRAQDTVWSSVGAGVSLVCEASAVPRVQEVVWRHEGRQLGHSANLSIIESHHDTGVRSSLSIASVELTNFGEYSCSVTNVMGTSTMTIHLNQADSLPLLVLVSGSIGGLLLTIVIIVVIVTCRKVQKTPDNVANKGSTTSPQADRFSNSSNETKAATLSSGDEDLDGSDSLPEYHENYIKSQPDLLSTSVSVKPQYSYSSHLPDNSRYRSHIPGTYSQYSYQHPSSTSLNYPRVTYSDYTSTYNITDAVYGDSQNYSDNPVYTIYAGTSDPQYSNGRFNAVAQKLSVIGDFHTEDLNESSIGTHV